MKIAGTYYQPTFYYESLWCLLGFVILISIRWFIKNLKTGQLTCIYLLWYSLGRFVIEGMRDNEYVLMLGNLKIAQIISIVLIIIGLLMIIFCRKGTRFDNLYKDKQEKEIMF